MMRAIIVLTLSLAFSNAEFNPYQPGELEVKAEIISKWSLSHTLHVWSPSVQGNYPIVYSLTGFAGNFSEKKYFLALFVNFWFVSFRSD